MRLCLKEKAQGWEHKPSKSVYSPNVPSVTDVTKPSALCHVSLHVEKADAVCGSSIYLLCDGTQHKHVEMLRSSRVADQGRPKAVLWEKQAVNKTSGGCHGKA